MIDERRRNPSFLNPISLLVLVIPTVLDFGVVSPNRSSSFDIDDAVDEGRMSMKLDRLDKLPLVWCIFRLTVETAEPIEDPVVDLFGEQ